MAEPVAATIELTGDDLRLRPYRDGDVPALLAAVRESIATSARGSLGATRSMA